MSAVARKVLILAVLLLGATSARAGPESAQDVVGRLQGNLLAVMKAAAGLSVKERYERLLPAIEDAFHLPLIIRVASGPYWDRASSAQQERLVSAFKRKNISTVATFFDGYDGERFEFVAEKSGPQDTLLVDTRLVSDDSSVKLTYRLKAINERWRIVDVIVDDGISELMVRRSEYSRILEKDGIEGLIAALDGKADQLIAEQ